MKKRKIAKAAVAVLSIMTIGAAGAAITACDGCDDHVHKYGAWTIVDANKPTLTEGGLAERYCEADDGSVDTQVLPNLSDKSFWTEGTKVDSSCTAEGSRTFTSDYGTVTITVPKDSTVHTGGTWTITEDPTDTAKGKASHNCEAEIDIPALSDKTVWTEKTADYVAPTHTKEGKKVYTSIYGTVTVKLDANADAHDYGDWTFVGEKPDFEKGGKIQCVCGEDATHVLVKDDVPNLHNTEFWSYEITTPPTHQTVGVATYTNKEYGLVLENVELSKIAHTFGDWKITKEPTETEEGEATRTCTQAGCADDETATETATLKVITDETFWSKTTFVADYSRPAGTTYTNATYGSFTVYTGVKLPAPYDNKTYSSVNIKLNDNGNIDISSSWNSHLLTVGADSIGYGTGYPFRGKFVFEFVDPDTGLVKVTQYNIVSSSTGTNPGDDDDDDWYEYALRAADEDAEIPRVYYGYVDTETGMLVLQVGNSWSEVVVAVPSETAVASSDYKASCCAGDYIISYKNINLLVTADGTYFGVSITDVNGNALTAGNCLTSNNSETIVVKDKSGKLVKAYALNGEKEWVVADGLEGVYTLPDNRIVVVNGASGVTVDGVKCNYEIVSNTDDSKIIGVIIGNTYYEYTLSGDGLAAGATCTVATPKVTLTYNMNGETITNSVAVSNEISKNVAIALAVPEHAAKEFVGWYTDAACTQAVVLNKDGKYVPGADVTLYAKWAARVTISLHNLLDDDADKSTIYVGEGEVISSKLTLYVKYQVVNGKYFDGWYTDAAFGHALSETSAASSDDVPELYAKWSDVHAMYGEYSGKQLLADSTLKEAHVEVTVDGTITGTVDGKTVEGKVYYADGKYTWSASSTAKGNAMWFDADNGLLVFPYHSDEAVMGGYPFLLAKDGAIGSNKFFDYTTTDKTKLVQYGNKLALLYDNGVYGNVTVVNAYGDALDIDTVESSKTLVFKQGNNTVLAIGTTADSFGTSKDEFGKSAVVSVLDGYQGVYTVGSVDYKLDGLGNITWTGDQYSIYEYIKTEDGKKIFGVFKRERFIKADENDDDDDEDEVVENKKEIVDRYENVEYWLLTIGATEADSSFAESKSTITFVGNTLEPIETFNRIPYDLSKIKLDDTESQLFRGWYRSATEQTGTAITEITLDGDDVSLYAKWALKVTVHLNSTIDGITLNDVYAGEGETLTIDVPTAENLRFVGWYENYENGEYTTEWVSGKTVVNAEITLYAKWETPAYMHTYGVITVKGTNANGGSSTYETISGTFTLGADGVATETTAAYPFNQNIGSFKVVDNSYNKSTGDIALNLKWDRDYYGYIDVETGIMLLNANYGSKTSAWNNSVYILSPYGTPASSEVSASYWDSGKVRLITYTNNGTAHNIFLYNGEVHFGVTFSDSKTYGEGTAVVAANAYNAPKLYVFDKDHELIAGFAYNGTTMKVTDGNEGEYSGTFNGEATTLTLNGVGGLTIGGKTTSYTVENGKFAFTIENAYYEITLNKEDNSYVCDKPMVEVTFNTNGGNTIAAIQANKTIAFDMPANPTREGYVFRDWYTDENLTIKANITDGKYTTSSAMTFYAKWDKLVTLTVVYGQGITDATLTYGANDKTAPIKPLHTNGKVFEKWVTIVDGNEVDYTAGSEITDDTTIYAKWYETASEFTGEYRGISFSSVNTGTGGTLDPANSAGYALTINSNGSIGSIDFAYNYSGSISWENEDEGVIAITASDNKVYKGYYDEAHGILAVNTSAWGASSKLLEASIRVYFLNATKVPEKGNVIGNCWNSGRTKLITLKLGGRADETVTLLVHDGKVYYNPTFKSSNASENLTVSNIYNTAKGYVYFYAESDTAQANPIATYKYANSSKGLLPYDGMDLNTYTDTASNAVTFDGVGNVTFIYNGNTKILPYEKAAAGAGYDYLASSGNTDYFEITIGANNVCTIYEPTYTLVFNSNGGSEIESVNLKAKESLFINTAAYNPVKLGYIFDGWYEDEGLTQRVYTYNSSNKLLSGEKTLYAKWTKGCIITTHIDDTEKKDTCKKDLTVQIGSGNNSSYYYLNYPTIPEGKVFLGWYTNEECTQSYTGGKIEDDLELWAKIVDFDAAIDYGTGNYPFIVTLENGVYVWKSSNKGKGSYSSTMIITAKATGALTFDYKVSSESSDKLEIKKGTTTLVPAFGGTDNDYQSLEVVLSAGETVTITYSKNSSSDDGDDTAYIRNIVFGAFDTTLEGDYTCTDAANVHLDGGMTITRGTETGTYMPMAAENTFDVFFMTEGVKTSHYTLVLDRTNNTYTLAENKVTISFNMHGTGDAISSVTVWNEIGYTLTTPTDPAGEKLFIGWYEDENFETPAVITDGKYIPTKTVELHAKWQLPHALMGEYKGANPCLNTNIAKESKDLTAGTLKVTDLGVGLGYGSGQITDYNTETGSFTITDSSTERYGAADIANGVLYIEYYAKTQNKPYDIRFLVKLIDGATKASMTYVTWDGGNTKLALVTYKNDLDQTVATQVVLIYDRLIYGNVSWTAKDGDTAITDFNNLTTANSITVTRDDKTWSFVKSGSNFVIEE